MVSRNLFILQPHLAQFAFLHILTARFQSLESVEGVREKGKGGQCVPTHWLRDRPKPHHFNQKGSRGNEPGILPHHYLSPSLLNYDWAFPVLQHCSLRIPYSSLSHNLPLDNGISATILWLQDKNQLC